MCILGFYATRIKRVSPTKILGQPDLVSIGIKDLAKRPDPTRLPYYQTTGKWNIDEYVIQLNDREGWNIPGVESMPDWEQEQEIKRALRLAGVQVEFVG